ncbi:hypothetical protein Baya_16953 [Bagarius yarrelli]|uniref:Uncharacterized protein n=1 Tax=Bagarius yarrelli TaxID=175774 RepID=A0A556VWZ2_BAGYA|nr:hypothetical protein Baya_16953 [Bagarius yarrelli]
MMVFNPLACRLSGDAVAAAAAAAAGLPLSPVVCRDRAFIPLPLGSKAKHMSPGVVCFVLLRFILGLMVPARTGSVFLWTEARELRSDFTSCIHRRRAWSGEAPPTDSGSEATPREPPPGYASS